MTSLVFVFFAITFSLSMGALAWCLAYLFFRREEP